MSSPPKSSSTSSSSSSVHHQKPSSSKPFIKSKSQTTSSLHFPSFRFSPDSEEIEEIVDNYDDGGDTDHNNDPGTSSSDHHDGETSSSSGAGAQTGGDISPLKEYILKHKWANKWDKRSLSLDLDLKGKIITAIEDKRRSFVSHFYNEEDEEEPTPPTSTTSHLTSSHSIPEQLAATTSTGGSALLDDEEDISVHSDSALIRSSNYNFHEENCPDYFELYQASPVDPEDLKDLVVEEIGVEADEDMMEDTTMLKEFVLPPERMSEHFGGLPCLYQPPSLMKGLRKYPIQKIVSDGQPQPPSPPWSSSSEEDEDVKEKRGKPFSVKSLVRNVIFEVLASPYMRYWIAILAIALFFDFDRRIMNMLWFGLGAGIPLICWDVLGGGRGSGSGEKSYKGSGKGLNVAEMDQVRREEQVLQRNFMKSQGWMLTLAAPTTGSPDKDSTQAFPNYDAFKFHLRNTRTVFVRLRGPILIISNPHTKHRVPKRRLWNDPEISTDHVFMRHQQFNLFGAKVEIVPHGLAKKRVWCKKYPIAITIATKDKYCGKLLNLNENNKKGGGSPDESSGGGNPDRNQHVSFKDGSVRLGEEYKGEVYKEDGNCAGKTIYLFARTDREKDDWFRRFVAATKLHNSWSAPTPCPLTTHFLMYMKKACPTLQISAPTTPDAQSPRSTPTNEHFESVSVKHTAGGSPASSRKSTPEKEQQQRKMVEMITPTFLNAFIARLFYDFLRSPKWTHEVKQLIDRKLFFIRKPAFVQSLKVKELDLGDSLPKVSNVSAPVLDGQGLWIDLDINYVGNVIITLEAFVNFLKMGSNANVERDMETTMKRSQHSGRHAMFDSDAEDSGESSESDDEFDLEEDQHLNNKDGGDNNKGKDDTRGGMSGGGGGGGGSGGGVDKVVQDNRSKLMKYADTLSKSSVMRNKHVQKVVTGIAATPFMLTVEIKKVVGSLAMNFPPVPNDRVWIGFRGNPEIEINVRPKVGERVVSLSQVTGWIKKKLLLEFQRVMVSPNFMDITIPLMEFELPK